MTTSSDPPTNPEAETTTAQTAAALRRARYAQPLALYLQGGKAGEQGARQLFDLLYRMFVRDFRYWGQPDSVAEEIASESMLKIYRYAHTVQDAAAFEKWATQIARNTFLTYLRDNQQETSHETNLDVDEWESVHQIVANPADGEPTTMLCLQGQLDKFHQDHPKRANVLERCAVNGWTVEEVSLALGRTLAATKEYLSQCRKRLQQYLQPCLE